MADSRPEPGPLTLISTSRTPLRIAVLAQRCAACWAAKGVLFREPLNPTQPVEPEQIVSPFKSVIVINVLLNVAFMCTIALATFLLTFRLALFAIILLLLRISIINYQFLLAFFLYTLLACDRLSRTFSSTRIALGTLPPHGQTFSVSNTPVTVYIAQPTDILSYLSAKLSSHDVISVDNLCYSAKLIFGELAGLCAFFDSGFFQNLFGSISAYTTNTGQWNPYGFVIGNINTNYTGHISSFSYPASLFTTKSNPAAACVAGSYKSPGQHLCDEQSCNSHIYVLQNF
jgi:hypothetical protein